MCQMELLDPYQDQVPTTVLTTKSVSIIGVAFPIPVVVIKFK